MLKRIEEADMKRAGEQVEAIRKEEEDRHRNDGVEFLGKEGASFVYYSRRSKDIVKLASSGHRRLELLSMASESWWRWFWTNERQQDEECFSWAGIAGECFSLHGDRRFTQESVLATGIWDISGKPFLNTGNGAYTVEEGNIAICGDCVNGKVFSRRSGYMDVPTAGMSSEDGLAFLDFFKSVSWRNEKDGEVMAGVVIQAILSGFLKMRVHAWVTAEAGSGKSSLKSSIADMLGGFCALFEGGDTTNAAVRAELDSRSVPALFDEMEGLGKIGKRNSMESVLDLIRSSSYGGTIKKGTKEGGVTSYLCRSSFILFSICNRIERDSDSTRFVELELVKKSENDFPAYRDELNSKKEEMMSRVTPGKLMGWCLLNASRIMRNVEIMTKYLQTESAGGRRAEVFANIYACVYSLTNEGEMSREYLAYVHSMMNASELACVRESEGERCLEYLLSSVLDSMDSRPVRELIEDSLSGTNTGAYTMTKLILSRSGLKYDEENKRLFVAYSKPALNGRSGVFHGTEWEGIHSKTLAIIPGAERPKDPVRIPKGGKARGVWVPYFAGKEGENA